MWKRGIKVNALLDNTSSRTYLDGYIAAELGFEGNPHERTVDVPDDNHVKLDSTVVEFMISSSDGNVSKVVSAYTAERVIGNMQLVDWSKHKPKWVHLKGLKFAHVGPRSVVPYYTCSLV